MSAVPQRPDPRQRAIIDSRSAKSAQKGGARWTRKGTVLRKLRDPDTSAHLLTPPLLATRSPFPRKAPESEYDSRVIEETLCGWSAVGALSVER